MSQQGIVVGVDASLSSDVAQRWAFEEARRRGVAVRLVCAYTWSVTMGAAEIYASDPDVGLEALRLGAERTVQQALEQAAAIAADLTVTGAAVEGAPAEVLPAESDTAELVVLGSRQLRATGSFLLGSVGSAVAARAACPIVITRGPAAYPEEGTQVIVGLDGTADAQPVLAFAFAMASRHGCPLHAVLCWHPTLISRARWSVEAAAEGQQQARRWLAESLAGWQEHYPDVAVNASVLDEHAVDGLVGQSPGEFLLVVGHRRRPVLAAVRSGSVSRGVLHHAACPVALVPLGGE